MHRTAHERDMARGRLSGGFTLDQAARLYRSSTMGRVLVCPGCGSPMRDVAGVCPEGGVSLIRCGTCGRGLVFDYPAGRISI
jgi:hypothetical protein